MIKRAPSVLGSGLGIAGTLSSLLAASAIITGACSPEFSTCESRRRCPVPEEAGGSGGAGGDDSPNLGGAPAEGGASGADGHGASGGEADAVAGAGGAGGSITGGAAGEAGSSGEAGVDPDASCADQPCQNGGECEADGETFTCICPTGFDGPYCEIDVEDCTGEACVSGPCVDAGLCSAPGCTPGETFCEGQDVKRCESDGETSTLEVTCRNQTCVQFGGAAMCTGVCAPGQTSCSGNGVQTCDGSGQWGTLEACGSATPSCTLGICGLPSSCHALESNCGAFANENCCESPIVAGGTFNRSNDPAYQATLSDFRLDKFEVTVGRFRKFIDEVVAGWRPVGGTGRHSHLNGERGLSRSDSSGFEAGWNDAWNQADSIFRMYTDRTDWNSTLSCSSVGYSTWTPSSGMNETRPITCVNWYQAYAFCIWDGGFLPSEAEWNYAAAGGSEQRTFPWGSAVPGANANLAAYNCSYDGVSGFCRGVNNIAPVGSIPAGHGRYGQADLAGNVTEWTLDSYSSPYAASCVNCAYLQPELSRVLRGGAFTEDAASLLSATRYDVVAHGSYITYGFRCARAP